WHRSRPHPTQEKPLHRPHTLLDMEITAVVVRASDEAVLMLPSGLPRVEVTEKFWFPDVAPVLRALPGIDAAVLTCLSEEPMVYLMLSIGAVPEDARW